MSITELQSKAQEEFDKLKSLERDRERYMFNRQELEQKLSESKNVKAELDLMDNDVKIFKLIGAVLVKQDLEEAQSTVQKRLCFIENEIKRVEANISDCNKKTETQREVISKTLKIAQEAARNN